MRFCVGHYRRLITDNWFGSCTVPWWTILEFSRHSARSSYLRMQAIWIKNSWLNISSKVNILPIILRRSPSKGHSGNGSYNVSKLLERRVEDNWTRHFSDRLPRRWMSVSILITLAYFLRRQYAQLHLHLHWEIFQESSSSIHPSKLYHLFHRGVCRIDTVASSKRGNGLG